MKMERQAGGDGGGTSGEDGEAGDDHLLTSSSAVAQYLGTQDDLTEAVDSVGDETMGGRELELPLVQPKRVEKRG